MMQVRSYAAHSKESPLEPFEIQRRDLRPEDVLIDILYCGVCHSDLHTARNDWQGTVYPTVPGHEIVGRVKGVGTKVTKFKAGDLVAVGCMVDSCLKCSSCRSGEEQLCLEGAIMTYNDEDRQTGEITYGGYSEAIVVREEFVLRVPEKLDIKRAAPLLCAGITTYSPLKHYQVGSGTKVGVIGLGGLGHMAVKLASALGAEVTLVTTSPSKAEDAKALGASRVLISKNKEEMKKAYGTLDLIIDTVPVPHDLSPYLQLLGIDGTLVIVGVIDMLPSFHSGFLLDGRKKVTASPIGGIAQTQELLEFCAEKGIQPDIEMIPIQDINHAYERMLKGDVKYRFVIDMGSLK